MTHLFVVLLVISPVEIPVPNRAPESWVSAIKRLDEVLELSGPACHWLPSFSGEVRWTRRTWRQVRDCPSLRDCKKLPSFEVAKWQLTALRRHITYLEAAKIERLHWADRIDEPLQSARQSLHVWELIRSAQDPHQFWSYRRLQLDQLRTHLGIEAYSHLLTLTE